MQEHISVLLHETVNILDPKEGETIVDATLGAGGHAKLVADRVGEYGYLIGIDEDEDAITRTRQALSGSRAKIFLAQNNFRNIDRVVADAQASAVNGIIFDLGLSTPQLEKSGRGFSFQKDEPLHMTFSKEVHEKVTAEVIVNEWSQETLEDILRGFGEERFARRIAGAIVTVRQAKHISRTGELVEIIEHAVPAWYRHRKTHCATKTFQALRIAANDEMGALSEGLEKGFALLAPGGKMAVITFHSIEDRFVKNFFKQKASEGKGILLTKKPIAPTKEETENNRRARSAKLRGLQKVL